MAHRTLNATTKFWGDGRETADPSRRHSGMRKLNGAQRVWAAVFPAISWNDAGDASEIYEALQTQGWVFSSRYGWRNKLETIGQ